MSTQKLVFSNAKGEELAARLDLPLDDQPIAYALFAHCFTCSKNLHAVRNISRALNRERIAVLRFDFTGLGESEGDFADTNFSSNIADLICAADYLKEKYRAPEILIGHSLGGAAVLQAAAKIPASKAVATIGAPCDPSHVQHLLQSARETIEEEGEAEVTLGGRTFNIKKQFLDDLEETRMTEKIRNLERALIIFHSPLDDTVGIENARHIFETAKHPKSFVSLDKANHLLSEESDSQYTGAVIAAWARKYLEEGDTPADAKAEAKQTDLPAEEKVTIVRTGRDHYYTEILANGHSLVSDEPESVGGTNKGPTPYSLLAASLGACTTITLRMYADRKEWPLEAVLVRVKHNKIHAKDCEDCESKSGKIDVFEREIEFVGELDPSQKERLLEIADKCPVHRSLHSEVVVRTTPREAD